ncbi:IS21 family transposase [Effusibacillus lacus]|nr:IS21 family transposase [Effusibacillus lacus]
MVDKEYIRKRHFMDGWSIREISRNCKISRQTVRKMLQEAEIPKYQLTKPKPRPAMERWIPVIEAWLQEEERSAPKKQRYVSSRIYERLREEYPEEFDAAESTVRYWVRKLRNKPQEAFVPLTADAGELAEADFGRAVIKIAGKPTDVHLFVMRLRHSGVIFAHAFSSEKIEAFLEGHRLAFEWFGGIPRSVRYDNPKTAVTKILTGPMRDEHELLSSLRAHYLFDSDFCRPGEPHEKGSVENGVGYVRRHACVPVPEVSDLEAFNTHLLAWCEKTRNKRWTLWEQERSALRALPIHAHRCATTHPVLVNKLCLVSFDYNRYSVPSAYVGKTLLLRAYAERIEILHREQVVAKHVRCHERKRTFLELEHYLPILAYKPHAATHAAVVRQLPEIYHRIRIRMVNSRPDGYKDFVAILLLHQIFPAKDILEAIEAIGPDVVTAEQIRAHLFRPPTSPTCQVPDELKTYRLMKQNPARYDMLVKGVVH